MHKHAKVGSMARMVSTRLLNFVRSKLVIYQNGKVICKWVLSQNHFKIHSSFYLVKNVFIKAKLLSCSPNELLICKTWCCGSVGLVQTIFSKFSFHNIFITKTILFIWLEND